MDREQEERRSLGFFVVVKESIKIIFTWRKIFSQITLSFILPLALIFLAHMEISAILLAKIHHNKRPLSHSKANTPRYNKLPDFATLNTIDLLLFTVVDFVPVGAFSLLSTSAVVCTTTCVYTSKSITFGGVMRVLPKVWKRLLITYLWSFLGFFVYIVVSTASSYFFAIIPSPIIVPAQAFVFLMLYPSGLVYINVISGLADVISVVEDIYGIQAMFKSKNLIKGKLGVSLAINLLLLIVSMAIQIVFYVFVALGHGSGFLRLGVAILCFLFLLNLLLFAPVVQTVIYFVCKSYHHENIDKSPLVDHLEVHLLADYLPPQADNV
ncbi:uncharacterized protein LOC115733600 [Rhodamnia argentea]|uniref:Uncharacterized protein LOC115733600 n=1 Tax=Rhodamnia argentea TaxID=178133 RepID=A0A8B8NCD9_9MYRT|nr:uncharacterized protein LOC115733600 [Rhodamnia argentea]